MLSEFHSRPRDEAVQKIEHYILKNNSGPHSRLPSERDMCAMWNFNRTTLRSAIQQLIFEGKLYNCKGSGTFVAEPKLVRNLQDLKSFSALCVEKGYQVETSILSARMIESNKQISQKLHITLGTKVYELMRLRRLGGTPAIVETSYLSLESHPGLDQHDFSKESLYAVLEKEYGEVLAAGSEGLSITYTTEEESALLDIPEGSAVFFLRGVVSNAREVPVEYFKSVVRSDVIRFAGELRR